MKDEALSLLDEKIYRFLRNQMSEDEGKELKKELAADPEKARRARTTALMIKSMQKKGEERDRRIIDAIGAMSDEEFRKAVRTHPKTVRLWPRRLAKYAAAACVAACMVVGGLRYSSYRQTVLLGNEAYTAYTPDIDATGNYRGATTTDTAAATLRPLFANVEKGEDISRTIQQLEKAYAQAQDEASPYNSYLDDIAWNLAIACLKDGDRAKPASILEEMARRNEGYDEIARPARELLKIIQELR